MEESERSKLFQERRTANPGIIYFQMLLGVKQIRNSMEMWSIENTLPDRAVHLKSSAALPTTGLLSFSLLLVQVKLSVA